MISVVVVTHNRKLLLEACLQSLFNQDASKDYEIIIIDNCSNDDTAKFIKKKYNNRVKFIMNMRKMGLAACKNLGVKSASGDIIAFIDDDCQASRNWSSIIKDSLVNYDFVGGPVLPTQNAAFPWWWRDSLNWLIGINPKPDNRYLPLGSNVAFKRYVFGALQKDSTYHLIAGNLDLPYLEDNYRIKKALALKFSMKINTAMIVHHIPQERLKILYLIKRSYNEGCSWAAWGRDPKTFVLSFIALAVGPARFLLTWDINRFFRMIVRLSYIIHYIKSRKPIYQEK